MTEKLKIKIYSADMIMLAYIFCQLAIVAAHGGLHWNHIFLFYIVSALFIAVISIIRRPTEPSVLHFIRTSYPLFLYIMFYYVAGAQIRFLGLSPYDSFFNALERNLFGVYPTIALQRILEVWLNEVSSVFYCFGILIPILALIILYNKKNLHLYENYIFALEMGCGACLLLSLLFPVGGPYKALQELYYMGIYGSNFVENFSFFMNNFTVSYNSFPAIYFCIITIASFYLWDFGKLYIIATFIFMIAAFWGGIYLRYHYLLDGLVALIIAFLVVAIASYVLYRANGKQA